MKIGNLGAFDPELQARGIVGLGRTSKTDELVWNRYAHDWEALALRAQTLLAVAQQQPLETTALTPVEQQILPPGREREALVRQRVGQQLFRGAVLAAYEECCCITGLAAPELLTASHIVPWAAAPEHRLNPANGLCLNALHDRAFDRGWLTVDPDDDLRVVVSARANRLSGPTGAAHDLLLRYHGQPIRRPEVFSPDPALLRHHRDHIFDQF
jgi:putative restriction endonuclease